MTKRPLLLSLIVLVIIYVMAAVTPGFERPKHVVADLDWHNIAHRGGPGLAPEHTLLAYQTARDNGATALELDVHSTSDDVLILMHDDDVDRTTNGNGNIRDFTLQQLQALDAGKGQMVPTLDQVFTAHPDVPYIIELKQQTPSIASDLCDAINQHKLNDKVIVGSFGAAPLAEFRTLCPDVATGMAQSEVVSYLALYWLGLSHWHWVDAQAMQLPPAQSGITLLTPNFIKNAQSEGRLIQAWTINEQADIDAISALGVDGIITDYPNRVHPF